jgi:hypothetical protein
LAFRHSTESYFTVTQLHSYLNEVNFSAGQADCSVRCPDCLYPLCDEACLESADHTNLCKVLKEEAKVSVLHR